VGKSCQPRRPWIKEPFNGLSHLAGIVLAIAGLVVLLVLADGRPWHTVAVSVYGGSLVLLYLASTLVHSVHCTPQTEARLERFDFAAIFLVIAGTYTPICLLVLGDAWGWTLLSIEWVLALVGIALAIRGSAQHKALRTGIYVAMGWLVVIAIVPLLGKMPAGTFAWLIAGGVVYTLGAIVFLTDRPKLWKSPHAAHGLWHLLVLAGSACHWISVLHVVR
jgi:hemolysin III